MIHLGSFERTPNAADWSGYVEVLDDDTGTAFDLTSALIEMEVTDQDGIRRLYGSTADGALDLVGGGFEFAFVSTRMKDLRAGSYTVNIRITDSVTGYVQEPAIALLPVLEGGYR